MTERAENFELHAADKNLSAARILCVLIAVIAPSGFVLDMLVAPDHVLQFLSYRLGISVVSLFCLWFAYRPGARAHGYLLGLIPTLATAVAVELMIIELGAHSSTYYAALTQLLLALAVTLYWSLRQVTFAAGFILAIWLIPALAEWGDLQLSVFSNNLYGLIIFLSIAVVGTYTRRRSFQREYEAQQALARTSGELADALSRLTELDKAKTNFFANISHELRTPITLILAPLDETLSARDAAVAPEHRGELQMAQRNALKLLRLVDDILELTRLESTTVRLRSDPVDLAGMARDLAARTQALGNRKQVAITAKIAGDDLMVPGDGAHLERAVLNLLANSLKFTESGGVELEVGPVDDGIQITVRDTGIGIPEAQLPHIFERFHQVDDGSTRRNTGTGIGLALVKEIVSLHGGRLRAESVLGEGTAIHVWLPRECRIPEHALERRSRERVADQERRQARGLPEWHEELRARDEYKFLQVDAATDRRIVPRPERAPSRSLRVLVVEDNADMIQLIVGLLSTEYEVLTATDGEAGLELATRRLPDLIVSDVMMPKMNGFEMVRALRDEPTTKHIPVVLLTARGQVEDRVEGREGGADAHLTKPFRPEELRVTVRELLRKQGQFLDSTRDERDAAMRILSEGVAHEILNPLGFIQNAFFALRETVDELRQLSASSADRRVVGLAGEIDRLYDSAREGIVRTRSAVEDLRRFGKGNALMPEMIDTAELVRGVTSLVGSRQGLTITTALDATTPAYVAPGQIDKILLNLIKNADQAADGPAEVTVKTWNGEGGVCLAVSDRGPGIPRENIEKIFHPYFTTKDPDQGSGLGLALCRQIARDMGGRLDVETELGKGTTFTLWVPASHAASEPALLAAPLLLRDRNTA